MDSATPQVESQSRKPRSVEKSPPTEIFKEPDLTGGTDLEYVRLISGYIHNANGSFMVGGHVASGAKISGIVKRITKMPAGDVYVTVALSASTDGSSGGGEQLRWIWFGPGCQLFGDLL